jgi:anti-anti-sigma factor
MATEGSTPRAVLDAAPFTFTIQHHRHGLIIQLFGELDVTVADRLRRSGGRAARRYDASDITFDCSKLDFLDGRGLDAIASVVDAAAPAGFAEVVGLNSTSQGLFDLCGPFGHMRLSDDRRSSPQG